MACKSYYIVFDDTVSGAPETAPIEQSVCRPPPPAAHGHPPAPCGMAPACLGIAAPARRFNAAPMPLHHLPRLDYITPTWPPPRTTHFLFSFLPFHPSYLVHWPPGRCGPHEGCRVIRWIRPFSRSFIIPPSSCLYGVADVSSDHFSKSCSCIVGFDDQFFFLLVALVALY